MIRSLSIRQSRLRVLVLTMQGTPWREFSAVKSLRTMFHDDPRLDVVVADARAPLAPWLRSTKFDIVVLSSTFLGARYSNRLLEQVKRKFEFVASTHALKVAMPQDDYDCCRLLDEWLSEWSVNIVYAAAPTNWSVLYPRSLRKAEIRLGYTSYITDRQIVAIESLKPWGNRSIDVSYRATSLPLNFGHLGQLKQSVGEIFRKKVLDASEFQLDINVGGGSAISGNRWLEFVESSRFVLVSPSGSSFIDPNGDLRELASEPRFVTGTLADFLIEASRRKLEWYELSNTAISPRNLEAVLRGTVQIAIPGEYSGILQPINHYVPLDQDLDVRCVLRNELDWHRIRSEARDAVLSVRRLRANELISELLELLQGSGRESDCEVRKSVVRQRVKWSCAALFSGMAIPIWRWLGAITLAMAGKALVIGRRILNQRSETTLN